MGFDDWCVGVVLCLLVTGRGGGDAGPDAGTDTGPGPDMGTQCASEAIGIVGRWRRRPDLRA